LLSTFAYTAIASHSATFTANFVTVTVHWHPEARRRIAPRTLADLAHTDNRWRLKEWSLVRKAIPTTLASSDDAIGASLERMRALETTPIKDTPLLDIEVVMTAVGTQRTWQFFVEQCGADRVAAILAMPSLESHWEGSRGGSVLEHKKAPPDADLLRQLVVRQNPKGRAECKLALTSLWESGDVAIHERLAYAFFDDEQWRSRALAEIFEQAPAFSSAQLTLARDPESMRKLLERRKQTDVVEYTEIVAGLGDEALPILLELAKTATKRLHTSHTLAMTVIAAEAVARHLASCISHPSTRDVIGEYFERHKELAALVLPAASQGASRNAALAKALMMKVCPDAGAKEDTVGLDDPAVPSILRDAPWRHPPRALPDLHLDLGAYPAQVTLPDERRREGESWLAQAQGGRPDMTADEAATYRAAHAKDTYSWRLVTEDGKCVPLDFVLELFCEGRWHNVQMLNVLLARFGGRALPGVRRVAMLSQVTEDVLVGLDDPHLAHPLAVAMLDEGRPRWSWFAAHPGAAALGLLAVAHDAPKRRAAEVLLRRLADAGHTSVILEAAGNNDQVRAFLERDPTLDVVVAPSVTMVPVARPRLVDGRALGDDALARILEMLSLSYIDAPHPGIEAVKQACQPRSLAEMAWDLGALADGGGKHSRARAYPDWMRTSLTHLADDEVIRRLTPALKHPSIYRVLESLAQRGVRSAAMELATAHERGDAPESLNRVAVTFNQSADELVETILPTTPLEPEGTTTLQFGNRTLRVGFDTTLAPILFSGGEPIASLPRVKKDDDPIAIRLARERWEELKEDVRTIAHLRGRALEDAMRIARRIPAPHFLAGWANHPLGKHQARGMVWAVERDGLVTFRVAEDGSFADVHDEALVLADAEYVRVPHPAELPPDVVEAWLRTFSDYGLIQPVAQLGRTPLPIEPAEANATEISRTLARPAPFATVMGILRDQGSRVRTLTRCAGIAHLDMKTQWADHKTFVTSVKLVFRDVANTQVPIPMSNIDPVELAESLFAMRLVVEAC